MRQLSQAATPILSASIRLATITYRRFIVIDPCIPRAPWTCGKYIGITYPPARSTRVSMAELFSDGRGWHHDLSLHRGRHRTPPALRPAYHANNPHRGRHLHQITLPERLTCRDRVEILRP